MRWGPILLEIPFFLAVGSAVVGRYGFAQAEECVEQLHCAVGSRGPSSMGNVCSPVLTFFLIPPKREQVLVVCSFSLNSTIVIAMLVTQSFNVDVIIPVNVGHRTPWCWRIVWSLLRMCAKCYRVRVWHEWVGVSVSHWWVLRWYRHDNGIITSLCRHCSLG